MSEDIRIVKFQTLITDIQRALDRGVISALLRSRMPWTANKENFNPVLSLIFNYDELNDMGKIIIENATIRISEYNLNYLDINGWKDMKTKIDAAKELIRRCRLNENRDKAYQFIFWAMMILTVDKTNGDEYLSLICDFAKMLKISDDEIVDILQVIKVLYHEVEEIKLQSETVQNIFSGVLALYN